MKLTKSLSLSFLLCSAFACSPLQNAYPCEQAQSNFTECGIEANLGCEAIEESQLQDEDLVEYERLAQSSCDELAGSGDEKSDLVAPSDWKGLNGTNQKSLNWLYQYVNYGYSQWNLIAEIRVRTFSGVGITYEAELDHIISSIPSQWSCSQKIVQSGIFSSTLLSGRGNNVCRHHSAVHMNILNRLGISGRVETGYSKASGHAWVEVYCPEGRVIADAYNGIYAIVKP